MAQKVCEETRGEKQHKRAGHSENAYNACDMDEVPIAYCLATRLDSRVRISRKAGFQQERRSSFQLGTCSGWRVLAAGCVHL
jgi:hypothetical protein